jgi:hypothetical protein
VGDLFESREEAAAKRRNTVVVLVLLGVVLMLGFVGWRIWEAHKPLPQLDACVALGYDAGTRIGTTATMCLKECSTNKVESCRVRRFLT